MNKPQREARPKQGASGKTGGGSGGGLGAILGGVTGGINAGGYTAGQDAVAGTPSTISDTGEISQGIVGHPATRGSIAPTTVRHPMLDAIFNHGQGSINAAQLNQQANIQQLAGDQQLGISKLEGQNRLDVEGLRNSGQQANTSLLGQNEIRLAEAKAQLAKADAMHTAQLGYMKQHNMAPSDENYVKAQAVLFPKELENESATADNELGVTKQRGNFLGSKRGKEAIDTGTGAELTKQAADNFQKTKTILGPNERSSAQSVLGIDPYLGIGNTPGGNQTTEQTIVDPNNPMSKKTIISQQPIPGRAGSFNSLRPLDINGALEAYKRQQSGDAGLGINPSIRSGVISSGVTPQDNTLPALTTPPSSNWFNNPAPKFQSPDQVPAGYRFGTRADGSFGLIPNQVDPLGVNSSSSNLLQF